MNDTTSTRADFGVLGLGVMGQNLALNVADRGFHVAVWNLETEQTTAFAARHAEASLVPTTTLEQFVAALAPPRRILLMITAGAPVDSVLDQLTPLLSGGDIVIDGGNSRFQDTERRTATLAGSDLHFVGMGVSGGAEGARHGPSLMPGGSSEAYSALEPVLTAIAARSDAGACVTHIGPGGAGHFVKMVHNGIEYADMQLIAESWDVLRRSGRSDADIAAAFARWNEGPLESYLVEITAKILEVRHPDGGLLVDRVLDRAGQKGTGRWTVMAGLELGVALPTLAAAVDARVLSSQKVERVANARELGASFAEEAASASLDIGTVEDALWSAKACGYAQGMRLIHEAAREHGWGIDRGELARIWKGGCIIRGRILDDLREAFARDPERPDVLFAEPIREALATRHGALREFCAWAQQHGVPVPASSASLAYLDASRSAELPQSLTQAQRDAFGSHTYRLKDDPDGPAHHTDWLG